MFQFWGLFFLLSLVSCSNPNEITHEERKPEFLSSDIISNIRNWEYDMAILFHAPWCDYCRQLTPSWNDIIKLLEKRKNLKIGYFNCEYPLKNADFCEQMLVDRYPTIYFIGFGDFRQKQSQLSSNIVRYEADIIPNAIYDWIRFLSFTSKIHRGWSYLKDFSSGIWWSGKEEKGVNKISNSKYRAKQIISLEKEVLLLKSKLERYEILELFEKLPNRGDAFAHLAQAEANRTTSYSTYSAILIDCLSEYAVEYCKYARNEDYCALAAECALSYMASEKCRPNSCPFKDLGCRVVSSCLKPDTFERYRLGE